MIPRLSFVGAAASNVVPVDDGYLNSSTHSENAILRMGVSSGTKGNKETKRPSEPNMAKVALESLLLPSIKELGRVPSRKVSNFTLDQSNHSKKDSQQTPAPMLRGGSLRDSKRELLRGETSENSTAVFSSRASSAGGGRDESHSHGSLARQSSNKGIPRVTSFGNRLDRQGSANAMTTLSSSGRASSFSSNRAQLSSRAPLTSRLAPPLMAREASSSALDFAGGGEAGGVEWGGATGETPLQRAPSIGFHRQSSFSGVSTGPKLEQECLSKRYREYPKGKTIAAIKELNTTKLKLSSMAMGIHRGSGPTLVTNHIAIGGRDDAANGELLFKMGITHVLNCARQLPNPHEFSKKHKFVYLKIPLMDDEAEDVVAVMNQARQFIKRVEDLKGRVLVHCIAGASRSVAVVILYCILQHKMTLRQIYEYIKAIRPQISVNDGFKMQCAMTEIKEFGATSVASVRCGRDWDFYKWRSIKHEYSELPEVTTAFCALM